MPARLLTDFDALTFDNYGTLVDWESGILAALRSWAAGEGLVVADDRLLEIFAAVEPDEQAKHPDLPYTAILRAVHGRIAAALGARPDERSAAAFAASVADWPVFPDTVVALRYLQRHYVLAAISNVDRASFRGTATKLGIAFDVVVTADEAGAYKPSPRNFLAAIGKLGERGIAAGRILHVGQSWFHDIAPAARLGLATLWVDRRRGRTGWGATPPPPEPAITATFVAADLAELVERHRELLREMAGANEDRR